MYKTSSMNAVVVLLPKFTATGPAVISVGVVNAAVWSGPVHPFDPPAAGLIARSLLPDAAYRRSARVTVALGITRIATGDWMGSPARHKTLDVSSCLWVSSA